MIGVGVDLGATAVRLLEVRGKKGVFRVTRFVERPVSGEGADRRAAAAEALASAARAARLRGSGVRVGLSGRDVILRYVQVPPVPDWQLRDLMRMEAEGLGGEARDLAFDFNGLPAVASATGEDSFLLALAREEVLEGACRSVEGAGLRVDAFTPNPVALFGAFARGGPEPKGWTLLACVGEESTDLALLSEEDLAFARSVSGGGRAFTEAVASRFNVSTAKADRLKRELATIDPAARDRYASSQEEKVSHAALTAAGGVHTLLQSVPMLAKTQARLSESRLERVLLCGGGSRLRGLEAYLRSSLGVPVEGFDPFEALDLSALPGEEAQALDGRRAEAVVALGLALGAADPDLYALEIRPRRLARARAFRERTVWAIGAAALAGAFLVADFVVTASRASSAEETASTLDVLNRKREKEHAAVEEAGAQALALGRKAALLEERAQGGTSLVRAIRLAERLLPEDLWIARTALERRKDADLRTPEEGGPIVVFEGRGREGAGDLTAALAAFDAALQAEGLAVRTKTIRDPRAREGEFSFTVELNFFPAEAAPAEAPQEPRGRRG